MNLVTFPGLNLEFNVSRIAISFGNLKIYWYAICIVFGIIVSLVLSSRAKEKFEISFEDFLEIMIFSLALGLIGARLYYVLFNLKYYLENPSKIFAISDGGLAIYGGLIAGAITVTLVAKKKNLKVFNFFDFVMPYLALSQAFGRFGNFFNVEAYGTETTNIFRMGINTLEGYKEVHPCFIYEAIGCFIIFIILKFLQKNRKYEGQIFSSYLIFYGIIRFFIEEIRSDSLMFFNLKVSQIISLISIFTGILIKYISIKNNSKSRKISNFAMKK